MAVGVSGCEPAVVVHRPMVALHRRSLAKNHDSGYKTVYPFTRSGWPCVSTVGHVAIGRSHTRGRRLDIRTSRNGSAMRWRSCCFDVLAGRGQCV